MRRNCWKRGNTIGSGPISCRRIKRKYIESAHLHSDRPLPVSISLPLTETAFTSSTLFPFFDGLIPEGWILDIASRTYGARSPEETIVDITILSRPPESHAGRKAIMKTGIYNNKIMRGCFLILNYKDLNVTKEAVSYLKKLDGIDDCIIVIFDNGSGNGSLESLNDLYANDAGVIVGGSEVNLGFSEGNNAAYKLALEHCDCEGFDYAVEMNSDVMIHQKDFISRIKKYAEEGRLAVIGPDVFNSRLKRHENPLFAEIPSASDIDGHIESQEYQLKNLNAAVSKWRKSEIKARLGRLFPYWAIQIYRKAGNDNNSGNNYKKMHHEPVLHGCCLIYLRPYLERESVLFEPDTFLYGEEILLSVKCRTKGYRVMYAPGLKIEHREAVSTKTGKTAEEHVRQRLENLIHAYRIVKKTIEDNPWE